MLIKGAHGGPADNRPALVHVMFFLSKRLHAITWIDDDPVHWHHLAAQRVKQALGYNGQAPILYITLFYRVNMD